MIYKKNSSSKTNDQLESVSVVMIVYNEELGIESVIKDYYKNIFLKLSKGSEFIVYLDKPTDKTPQIVKELSKKLNLRIVEGKKNLKYAGALRKALSFARNDWVFYSDSSGKHAAKDFWKLVKYSNDYDIINGNRSNRSDPVIRQIVTFLQRLFVSIIFRMPQYDYNTGFKLIHKSVLDSILPISNSVNFTISTELLIRAYKEGSKIVDVPISFKSRPTKSTGTQYFQLIKMALDSLVGYLIIFLEFNFGLFKNK
ncbi:MAG: glycosyltransferase family 2 protein [Candidatus Pacebacteria bacterium]|nr:glycosyltransferase family 2 protein [Candidatus Paceibacterota bacterium]